MTAEQKQAWDMLDKHFDSKMKSVLADKEKSYQEKITQLERYIGNIEWREFKRSYPDADKYRSKMIEKQKTIGGSPSLEDLYLLARGEQELKKAGVEEFQNVFKQKNSSDNSTF
jgi:hypothetical protein